MAQRVLILGGAGFIGSAIAKRYVREGCRVTVVDGLCRKTGGAKEHLADVLDRVVFIESRVEDIDDINELIDDHDMVIDSMAWTSHLSALSNPLYDLELNVRSHLSLLTRIRDNTSARFIYLGTRSQYGNAPVAAITEETPMVPSDIQGIHKLAAELYYNLYSRLKKINAVSIRFPNCFGENQPTEGDDIGLIGGFIRDILAGKTIVIYGEGRKRYIAFVDDLADVVLRIGLIDFRGFSAFNYSGRLVLIEDLIRMLIDTAGTGRYEKKELPDDIRAIDIGNAVFDDSKLAGLIGKLPLADIRSALRGTVEYFKKNSLCTP